MFLMFKKKKKKKKQSCKLQLCVVTYTTKNNTTYTLTVVATEYLETSILIVASSGSNMCVSFLILFSSYFCFVFIRMIFMMMMNFFSLCCWCCWVFAWSLWIYFSCLFCRSKALWSIIKKFKTFKRIHSIFFCNMLPYTNSFFLLAFKINCRQKIFSFFILSSMALQIFFSDIIYVLP